MEKEIVTIDSPQYRIKKETNVTKNKVTYYAQIKCLDSTSNEYWYSNLYSINSSKTKFNTEDEAREIIKSRLEEPVINIEYIKY